MKAPALLLPLLKPYNFNLRGYLYRRVTCPLCGKPYYRAVSESVLGLDDPRLGNAHLHACNLVWIRETEEKAFFAELAFRA